MPLITHFTTAIFVRNATYGWRANAAAADTRTVRIIAQRDQRNLHWMERMLEAEYGPPGAFRLPLKVTAYDSSGKEIEIPRCDICGNGKTQIIGKNAFCWVCMVCGGSVE